MENTSSQLNLPDDRNILKRSFINFGIEIVIISKFPKAILVDRDKTKRIIDEIIVTRLVFI